MTTLKSEVNRKRKLCLNYLTEKTFNSLKKHKVQRNRVKKTRTFPKLFYNYMRQRTRNNDPIPLLKTDDVVELCKENGKATHPSHFFQPFFTLEATLTADNYSVHAAPTIDSMVITEVIVLQELLKLKEIKSPGPDVIPANLLNKLAVKLVENLCLLLGTSLAAGRLLPDWKTV
ncbi:unnamed protein product [Schistocephalus solidus]|uniref:Uncharacterized protein n=1 Tax=Schistocephalus solidus TaxID=70667 RepID=A0A183SSP7_SCHSO|nr:unnamed protein product [Schistocephalus solidus]